MTPWTQSLWLWRARAGYAVARQMMGWPALLKQPRTWNWMQGQFARLANLGDHSAQSFYGHILLFRGQGVAARAEGIRFLRLAAQAGEGKAAYQLGLLSLKGDVTNPVDAAETAKWWEIAATAGHPLAAHKLAELYRQGEVNLPINLAQAERLQRRAADLGL